MSQANGDFWTERGQSVEQIMQEYARLCDLIEFAAQGGDIERYAGHSILYVDPETHQIIGANEAALRLLGYPAGDLVARSIHDLETPDHKNSFVPRRYVETSLQQEVYPAYYQHSEGHKFWVQVHKRILHKAGGSVLHYQLEDFPMAQRLWQELQRREDNGFRFQQKLTHLTEITLQLSQIDSFDLLCQTAIQHGVVSLDFDRLGIWFVDIEHQVMVGSYGVDEQGQVRPEHDLRWAYANTYVEDFINGKTEVNTAQEAPLYNHKSEIIEYGWHLAAPLLHGNCFIGILTCDNYLRKQRMKPYEPELLRLYAITVGHLTELARMRDQSLALRLKQERSQLLRQFITNVGHDFKTPLSAINTKSFLIQRAPTPEKREELAHGIEQQVMVISKTLNDMLEFIELESNLTLHPIMTNLYSVISEVVEKYRALSQAKRLHWQVTLNQVLRIPLDSYYLQRALGELLDNAVQYTPEGGTIEVSIMPEVDDMHEVRVRVRDTGIGIPPHALDQIFQPLYRVDEARTERHSGFGLTIAKTIVESHGGRILVTSILGKGSTFDIFLPSN